MVVVGTDEWLGPQGAKAAAAGPVREWFVSNPREADHVPGACFGAPISNKGGALHQVPLPPTLPPTLPPPSPSPSTATPPPLHPPLHPPSPPPAPPRQGILDFVAANPHCHPDRYYEAVSAAVADEASPIHAFPRALQRTTG